jgi:HEAT repeat protein
MRALEHERGSEARLAAARALRELAHEPDLSPSDLKGALARMLGDPEDRVRRVGAQMAAELLEPQESEAVLVERLSDDSELVRVQAAGLLADLDRLSSREALRPALSDRAFPVRFEAARGLAAQGDGAGLETLIEGLDDDGLRFRALGALVELGDTRALPAIQRIFRQKLLPGFERAQAAGALSKFGDPEGAEYLIRRTQKRWSLERAFAIELCGEVKAPGAFARLMEILGDPVDACRGAAARGLGRLGDPRALQPLKAMVENCSEPDELRLDAAEGACLLDPRAGRAQLRASAESFRSAEAREEAQEILEDVE